MNPYWTALASELTPYVPGEQPRIANLVKLNTNESPYGPSPHVVTAVRDAAADTLRLYPDPEAKDREAAQGFWKPGKDGLRLGLAVLGACSTARYEDVESPEPRDLAGALLLGGARQVVATLCNVDSEASTRFMEAFYDEMHKGRDVVHAALEGAKLRLRPILMTSFAFILGCVPLAIASGSGASGRQILGTVVVTGMMAATALAVFIVPLLFVLFESIALRFGRRDTEVSHAMQGGD